jgi:hypothetical protein
MVSAAKNKQTRNQGPGLFFFTVWGRNGIAHILSTIQIFPVMMRELNHELDHYALQREYACVTFPHVFTGERGSIYLGSIGQ